MMRAQLRKTPRHADDIAAVDGLALQVRERARETDSSTPEGERAPPFPPRNAPSLSR